VNQGAPHPYMHRSAEYQNTQHGHGAWIFISWVLLEGTIISHETVPGTKDGTEWHVTYHQTQRTLLQWHVTYNRILTRAVSRFLLWIIPKIQILCGTLYMQMLICNAKVSFWGMLHLPKDKNSFACTLALWEN